MTKDMTKGRPLSLIIGFCLPMIFGNIFQQLYNMVDSIIVGQYVGVKAFAGVGSVGAVYFLVIGTATGMCSGFSIPVAQKFGANDLKEMRRTVYNAELLSAALAIILTAVTVIFCKPLLRLMQTTPDTFEFAYSYIVVIFMGIPVTMFYNLMSGILRALGDSKTPLKYLLIASGLNIVFDLLFIIALGFGVTGAAAATVLSQAISGVMCFIYMKRRLPVLVYQDGEKAVDTELMKHIAALGLPMAFQFSITAVGSIILQTAVNTLGSVAVAGISAGQKVQNLVSAPMDTLGVTMATYGGQNLGAKKIDRIHEGTRVAFAVSMIYTIIITAVVFFAGETMTHIFLRSGDTDYTAILDAVRHFLRVTCLFYPVLGLLFLFRNLLQGLGFSLVTMLAGAVELAARIIVSFGFVYRIGFDAAVFAAPSAWTAACVLLIFIYLIKIRSLDRRFCVKSVTIGKPAHIR